MGASRRLASALAVVAMLALTAVGASAITYGEPDGKGHPNVGAVLENDRAICTGTYIGKGTGDHKGHGIFLTAAHCIGSPEKSGVYAVSFEPDAEGGYPGIAYVYPGYTWKQGDPGDMAVIVLDEVPAGIEPASLPGEGQLSELAKAGELKKTRFTAVGYGLDETGADSVERRVAESRYTTLTKAWLKLSQNNAQGYGGTCYGDSGGPNFFVDPITKEDAFIAGLTITGDSMCRATNVTYRLDTPEAQAFIRGFIGTPAP